MDVNVDPVDADRAHGALDGHHSNGRQPRSRRKTRLVRGALIFCVVAVGGLLAASLISVPYEAITPGSTLKVGTLITVPKAKRHYSPGSVSLVDVKLIHLTVIGRLVYGLNHDNEILPIDRVLGTESSSDYNEQGVIDMSLAQQAATFVSFRQLGYDVRVGLHGVVIYAIGQNSPAVGSTQSNSLRVGDLVLNIDDHAVTSTVALQQLIRQHAPGDLVSLQVRTLNTSRQRTVRITLGRFQTSRDVTQCQVVEEKTGGQATSGTACLGVDPMQMTTIADQPFAVNLSSEGIIGPSAGLAFTLGLIKSLDTGDLTNGLQIAASGTMSIDGVVGDVGGVKQKTIAVRQSGASVFFVPSIEYKLAKANAGAHLRVFGVKNIEEALRDLRSLGGRIVKVSQ